MKFDDINKGIEYLRLQVKKLDARPSLLFMKANVFVDSLTKYACWSNMEANFFANLLVSNDIFVIDKGFLKMTQNGYSFLFDKETPLKIDFFQTLPIQGKPNESVFYIIWNIIGNDKGYNPYYVDGKEYYDCIKKFVIDLPPTYSQYTKKLHDEGKSTTRSIWGLELFRQLTTDEMVQFLNVLAEQINSRLSLNQESGESFENMNDVSSQEEGNITMNTKQPKIFISHNSEDKDYAKALVQLLINLGVNEEKDIFCSSVPGCGVTFGNSFIEAIKSQYEKHELIMIYVHSPRYYNSHVSLCEMGASWIMKNKHFSFLTKDCDFKMLDAVIPATETAVKAGQESTYHLLNDFKDEMERIFRLKPKSHSRWEEFKSDFIKAFN